MNDTLNNARELAERGYHLFPLVSGGKTPALTGNWQSVVTRDPRVLERWFARTSCNIGVACEPSGIFAIDLDTAKAGADGPAHGIESLRELAAGRDFPRTLTVVTPSGGTHLYFRQPADGRRLRNTARRLGPLIDTASRACHGIPRASSATTFASCDHAHRAPCRVRRARTRARRTVNNVHAPTGCQFGAEGECRSRGLGRECSCPPQRGGWRSP